MKEDVHLKTNDAINLKKRHLNNQLREINVFVEVKQTVLVSMWRTTADSRLCTSSVI